MKRINKYIYDHFENDKFSILEHFENSKFSILEHFENSKFSILGHLENPKFSIWERLHINKDTGNHSYNYHPKTKNELEELVNKLVKERGNDADLNDIDTSEIKDMKSEMKDINTKIDRLEYKMTDGFETLELLTENNTNELNKVKIKVSKLEKRVAEFNTVN